MPTSERPEPMRIWLLGGFRVGVGSRTITEEAWRLRKAAALVKLLALARGHRFHREEIMQLLWPDQAPQAAANNLHYTLHHARRTLGATLTSASPYLRLQSEQLALCPGGLLWVDVEAFDDAASVARRTREPAAYRRAIELYAGELLPADRYEDWAEARRLELRSAFLSLLVELAALYEERGEYGAGIEALGKVLAEEPTSEEAHVSLMRLYAFSGRQGEALGQYDRLKEVLSKELNTEPGPDGRRLRQEIEAGSFPGERPAGGPQPEEPSSAGRHNLPAGRTSFIGRERELVEVKRALAMTRLLTLTGVGGSGKTRLALEVAGDLVGAYPDGVWLAELAPLADPGLVPQAVARALGVKEQPGQPLTDTLAETLRTKRTLLVLDNCEHLLDGAARLVDALLDSCPHLRILATSREALGIAGEVRWTVPSLSMLDPQSADTVEELERSESARLFVERASARRPGFSLTPDNTQAVAQICHRLEGIPLAIELAAARVGALSIKQISERLTDSLKLLTGGDRTQVPKQRTLRGTLDWSHELLSTNEKKLFGRLSVFAGGWTLEAAEEVGADGSIEGSDVLDLLGRLVDKSLVVAEAEAQGAVRYRMLEPIRQYARERLEESEEAEAIQRRHAEFFLALAEEAEPEVEGPQQAARLERLEAEHDNLRAALSWSLERGEEAELGLRVAGALGQFWYLRGYLGEGRRWLEEALAKSSPASTAARANALHRLSFLAYLQGDLDRAQEASEEGLKLEGVEQFWNIADRRSAAAGLRLMLGIVASVRGDSERAIQLYEESLALSRKVGDKRGIADNLLLLGIEMRSWGNFEKARDLLEEGMVVAREVGDPELLAAFLNQLCDTFVLQGDLERATVVGEKAVAICREQNHRILLSDALCNLGWAALLRGDPGRATTLYAESLELKRELGENPLLVKLTVALPETLDGLACVAVARGETERAVRLFGATRALHKQVRDHLTLAREYAALREPYLAATRSQLSEEAWETAFAEGRAMGFEETVEYALSDEETATPLTTVAEQSSADKLPPTLTRREREVANLLERRFTSRQIASELHISEHTVDKHVANILRKLNLHSREQVAVQMAKQRSHPF
jgi:predicted ATPase/DNA-binding SARP family transcriptional activator/DNA-binding NarL/FixJ family response regulator